MYAFRKMILPTIIALITTSTAAIIPAAQPMLVAELPIEVLNEQLTYILPSSDNSFESICRLENNLYAMVQGQNISNQGLVMFYTAVSHYFDNGMLAYFVEAAAHNGHLPVVMILTNILVAVRMHVLYFLDLAIQCAAQNGHFDIVDYFVKRFPATSAVSQGFEHSLLTVASQVNNSEHNIHIARNLIAILIAADETTRSLVDLSEAFAVAAKAGNVALVTEFMVNADCFISHQGYGNALWFAAMEGKLEVIELLIVNANEQLESFYLLQAARSAANNGYRTIAELCQSAHH